MSRGRMLYIRRKINATQSLMKITRAMEMVARAKARRVEAEYRNFKPFLQEVEKLWRRIPKRFIVPSFFEKGDRELLVILSSDMGLCGAYNSELLRKAEETLSSLKNPSLILIGAKAANHFKNNQNVYKVYDKFYDVPEFSKASTVVEDILTFLSKNGPARVLVLYSHFKNVLIQQPRVYELVPLEKEESTAEEYEYEPVPEILAPLVLHYYLSAKMLDFMFHGKLSEHYARQNAMKNATDNAQEVIRRLTLEYNKARQASITEELIEIVTGAEALKEIEE